MTQGGTAAERCHIHDLGPGQSFTVRNELHFPVQRNRSARSGLGHMRSNWLFIEVRKSTWPPLASGHRPSIPKTTACLGRFDDVELAEALCVCDHLDCDDLAVGNREGHDGGERA